jgi:hypothetical protein
MDRQKEIALALSACPLSVAEKAGVYVLERSGYVKVRDSQNGFTAIVQHALPISQDPQCMDAEGTRTFLPRYLKVAELRAEGKTPDEIKQFVADAFAKGIFQPPSRPGIDYMLSVGTTEDHVSVTVNRAASDLARLSSAASFGSVTVSRGRPCSSRSRHSSRRALNSLAFCSAPFVG